MKYLALLVGLTALSVQANQQETEQLKGLTIKPVETVKKKQPSVTVNGTKFLKRAVKKVKGQKHLTDLTLPDVISGEVLYSEDGFTEYLVTGEIIVKLSSNVGLDHFNNIDGLTIKQAYKDFYILKSEANSDLLALVSQLNAMPEVLSATIDLVDRNINHF